jgi:hypothetical protein
MYARIEPGETRVVGAYEFRAPDGPPGPVEVTVAVRDRRGAVFVLPPQRLRPGRTSRASVTEFCAIGV